MTKLAVSLARASVAIAFVLSAGSAYALMNHTWVSSTGTGDCSRTSPCANIPTALTMTNAGGVISLLDAGASDDGSPFITKSITIRAEGVDAGSTFAPSGGAAFTVAAQPNDVIILEGLHLSGGGLNVLSAGQVHVVRCVITNNNIVGEGGITFRPNSAGKLSVTDTVIINLGSGTGGGIRINPQAGGSAEVALKRVTVNGNAFGIAADGTGSTAGINVTIADSIVANNSQDGILATTPPGGAPIAVQVTNTQAVNNNAFGIRSIGTGVTMRVKNSDISGNGTGLTFTGGGALLTSGNNQVVANGTNGSFSGTLPLQ